MKTSIPDELLTSFDKMSGGTLLAAAVFLACIVFINFNVFAERFPSEMLPY